MSRIDIIGQNGNDGDHYEQCASGKAVSIKLDRFFPYNIPDDANRLAVLNAWRDSHHKQVDEIHDELLKELGEKIDTNTNT